MNVCNFCGAPLDDDAIFCANCGRKVENQGKKCPRCGIVVLDDSVFCAKCGARLDEQVVTHIDSPQIVTSVMPPQEEEEVIYDWEKDEKIRKWKTIILSIVLILIIAASCYFVYKNYNKDGNPPTIETEDNSNCPSEYDHLANDEMNLEDEQTKLDLLKIRKDNIWLAFMNAYDDIKDSLNLYDYGPKQIDYFVYDITGDEIPELWIKYGTCEADFKIIVCAYDKDCNYKTIWLSYAGHSGFYEGNGYILRVYAHMGYAYWTKLTYHGKKIVETTIYEEDTNEVDDEGNADPRDYKEPREKYIELNSFSDVEPIKRALEKLELK